jgi:hypothetical protein
VYEEFEAAKEKMLASILPLTRRIAAGPDCHPNGP